MPDKQPQLGADDVVELAADHNFIISKIDLLSRSREWVDEIGDEDLEVMNTRSLGFVLTLLKRATIFREISRDGRMGQSPYPESSLRGCWAH